MEYFTLGFRICSPDKMKNIMIFKIVARGITVEVDILIKPKTSYSYIYSLL